MSKEVHLYDVNMKYIKTFKSTKECAEYFEKESDYINHNLKYCDKIRKNEIWYRIKRMRVDLLKEDNK